MSEITPPSAGTAQELIELFKTVWQADDSAQRLDVRLSNLRNEAKRQEIEANLDATEETFTFARDALIALIKDNASRPVTLKSIDRDNPTIFNLYGTSRRARSPLTEISGTLSRLRNANALEIRASKKGLHRARPPLFLALIIDKGELVSDIEFND